MFKGSCYWHYHVGAFLKYSKIDLLAETQQNRVSITYTGVKKTQHNGNTILFYKFATKLYFVFIICLPDISNEIVVLLFSSLHLCNENTILLYIVQQKNCIFIIGPASPRSPSKHIDKNTYSTRTTTKVATKKGGKGA